MNKSIRGKIKKMLLTLVISTSFFSVVAFANAADVKFFDASNYTGATQTISISSTEQAKKGKIRTSLKVSSILVPAGFTVKIFKASNYDASKGNKVLNAGRHVLTGDWNNIIKSIEIKKVQNDWFGTPDNTLERLNKNADGLGGLGVTVPPAVAK